MGKLSLKKNQAQRSEKQTSINSFFKPPVKNAPASSSSLFSTIGSSGAPQSTERPKSKPVVQKCQVPSTSPEKSNKRTSPEKSNKRTKPPVVDLTAESENVPKTSNGQTNDVHLNKSESPLKECGPGANDDAKPGSFFFSPGASEHAKPKKSQSNKSHSSRPTVEADLINEINSNSEAEDITVVPETQFPKCSKSTTPKLSFSESKDSSDLDDSLTVIPATPEARLPVNTKKRVYSRSFVLSSSNLTSSHPGKLKPRKNVKGKTASAKNQVSPYEGCNYSLSGSNKEVEKYSELQMQVLYSSHGMTSRPVAPPSSGAEGKQNVDKSPKSVKMEGAKDSDFALSSRQVCSNSVSENCDSMEIEGPQTDSLARTYINGESSDIKTKKPHVVSSKVQKHTEKTGRSMSDQTHDLNLVKSGVKRSCTKGTGVSPNPKRQASGQIYGEVTATKRDLVSKMDCLPVSKSDIFGPEKGSTHEDRTRDSMQDDFSDDIFEDPEVVNPHKKSAKKHRLQMTTMKTSDRKSFSYSKVISSHKGKKPQHVSPKISNSRKTEAVRGGDELLSNILEEINELKSPKAGASTPKSKGMHEPTSRGLVKLNISSVSPDNSEKIMSLGDEDDILSDIIGEIRGCTQAKQAHSYDKKLDRRWKKSDLKNQSIVGAEFDVDQFDLNSNVECPKRSPPSTTKQICAEQTLKADKIVELSEKEICVEPTCSSSSSRKETSPELELMDCGSVSSELVSSAVTVKTDSFRTKSEFDSQGTRSVGTSESSEEVQNEKPSKKVTDVLEAMDEFGDMDESWMHHVDLEKPAMDLSQSFSKFSPFKQAPDDYSPESCPAVCTKFGRHLVAGVQHVGHDVHLELKSVPDDKCRKCILQGFWTDTHVKTGDIVNVLSHFDASGLSYVNDRHGLLVVNPDYLISGTTVVSSVYCMRRSVLNAKFKGMDGRNVHMLYGSIIHSLFQQIIQEKNFNEQAILEAAHKILQENKFLHEMYALGLKEQAVMDEIKIYIPQMISWGEKHVHQGMYTFGERSQPKPDLVVTGVRDIEENVWSPRFGIKGKIDVTVDVKIHKHPGITRKVVPLELKTGKASFSIEHKGQVTLYSMMTSDRRPDPEMGILLYLKNGAMENVPAKEPNKKGLLQLRNELTHYLTNSLEKVAGPDGEETRFKHLPRPISNERACRKCPHLLTCSLYQKSIEHLTLPSHPMESLVPETLSHLSQAHLDFFVSWCYMMQLEDQASKSQDHNKGIWCKNALDREKKGGCLSSMILSSDPSTDKPLDDGNTIHTFVRHPTHSSSALTVNFTLGESVVVSCENKGLIALSIGYVMNFTEELIELSTDRNLRKHPDYRSMIFRLDKCNLYNSMGTNFSNLAKLMDNDPASARLRELLVDQRPPEFSHTLSKGAIEKVKHVFKKLNKPQKTAILKVLMSNDYVLIKGYPGTGKTSTIVALVRILVILGHSVLLTSYTHSAVDNILLKLVQCKVDFLRVGRLEKVHSSIHPYTAEVRTKNMHSVEELERFYASQQIVATTCFGVTHQLFTQRIFDVCIVDEASQILQPACMGPLFYSKKFALVGDPKQLPPVVQSQEAGSLGMDKSLIVRLDTNGATYELDVQYRMNRSIMELSNQLVYNGILKCGTDDVATRCLTIPTEDFLHQLPSDCGWIRDTLNTTPGFEVIFLDTAQVPAPESRSAEGQLQNEVEALIAMELSYSLVKSGINPTDIGIIAPYRNQVQYIRKTIEGVPALADDVEVNTIDQYQGRDKDVIIISCVRSQKAQENTRDILHDLRRLNVAITRAKYKMIFIGHVPTLQSYPPLKNLIEILQENQTYTLPKAAHTYLQVDALK